MHCLAGVRTDTTEAHQHAHVAQGPVGVLAGKDEGPLPRHGLEQGDGRVRERDAMFPCRLHPFCQNDPEPSIEIDLGPAHSDGPPGSGPRQDGKAQGLGAGAGELHEITDQHWQVAAAWRAGFSQADFKQS